MMLLCRLNILQRNENSLYIGRQSGINTHTTLFHLDLMVTYLIIRRPRTNLSKYSLVTWSLHSIFTQEIISTREGHPHLESLFEKSNNRIVAIVSNVDIAHLDYLSQSECNVIKYVN